MTNKVSAALGTQRQFTKAPLEVYQPRLINSQFGNGIGQRKDYNSQLLMGALGLLGANLGKEIYASNDRRAKVGRAEADYAFSVTNDQDKQQLAAIDILARSGRTGGISSNPFALARVSELQGQYVRDTLEADYRSWNSQQELAKNSQEEAQRYENFMSEKLGESGAVERADNRTTFQKGFYGEHAKNILANDMAFHKRKDAELDADTTTTLLSQVDKIAGDASVVNAKTPEERLAVLGKIQENVFNSNMLIGKNRQFRNKIAQLIGDKIAESGNVELMNDYGENVVKFGVDGEEVKVKDTIPAWNELKQKAYLNGMHIKGTAMNDAMERLVKGGTKDFDEEVAKLQVEQPEVFTALKDKLGTIRSSVRTEEKRRQQEAKANAKAELEAQLENINNTRANAALDKQWLAFSEGNEMTTDLGLSTSNTYMAIDKKGNPVRKAFTEDQITEFTLRKMQEILQTEPDPLKAAEKQMQLIGFNPVGKVKENIRSSISQALVFGKGVDRYFNMYRADPSAFAYLFPHEAKDMQLLEAVHLGNDKPINESFEDFKLIRSRRDDPAQRRLVNTQIENLDRKTFGIKMGGYTVDKYKNPELWSAYEGALEVACYLGDSNPQARATEFVQKNWQVLNYQYGKLAMPKSFYNGIPSQSVKDFLKWNSTDGYEPKFYNGKLTVGGKVYTKTEFAKEMLKFIQDEEALKAAGTGGSFANEEEEKEVILDGE